MTIHHSDQDPQLSVSKPPKSMGWILYLGIAFLIALWTIWGALFFLAVTWLLRLNPGKEIQTVLTDKDKKISRHIYRWLWLLPMIGVPGFVLAASGISSNSSVNERFFMALSPLIIYSPLLLYLNSKNLFVYRHAQQAIFLVALRAGLAGLAISMVKYPQDGLWLFLIGNGSLWLIGNIWAQNQATRGACWFMQRKGETSSVSEASESENINHPIMDKELAGMLDSLNADSIKAAKEKALHAFQTGTPTIKKRAIAVLAKLGEVEKF